MSTGNLKLKPVSSKAVGRRPSPTRAQLAPWEFDYMPSRDGKDANLMIMFHGLGDTKAAFAGLGRQINLPSTAVLSLQAPNAVPLMDMPSWTWYNTFDPMFNPLPNPNPTPTLKPLRHLLSQLQSLGWDLPSIHLFGWAQGGTMALELALSIATDPIAPPAQIENVEDTTPTASSSGSAPSRPGKRLGSVVSVCAGLESFPVQPVNAPTPAFWFTRSDPRSALALKHENSLRRAFRTLEISRVKPRPGGEGANNDMPRGGNEWIGIMKFWGQILRRGDEGWKGDGEIYEVIA